MSKRNRGGSQTTVNKQENTMSTEQQNEQTNQQPTEDQTTITGSIGSEPQAPEDGVVQQSSESNVGTDQQATPDADEQPATTDLETIEPVVEENSMPKHLAYIYLNLVGASSKDETAYVNVMAAKNTWVRENGYAAQRKMLAVLRHVFNLNGDEFLEAFNALLEIFHEYSDDCLGVRYALRGIHDQDCGFSKNVGKFFEMIVSLSCRIANPATRKAKITQTVEAEKVVEVATALVPAYGEKLRAYLEQFD